MTKIELPEPTGKCKYCGINTYPPDNKPATLPCGVFRNIGEAGLKDGEKVKVAFRCPYESKDEQLLLEQKIKNEGIPGESNWDDWV